MVQEYVKERLPVVVYPTSGSTLCPATIEVYVENFPMVQPFTPCVSCGSDSVQQVNEGEEESLAVMFSKPNSKMMSVGTVDTVVYSDPSITVLQILPPADIDIRSVSVSIFEMACGRSMGIYDGLAVLFD